jgi:DNA processing protein
MSEIAVPSSPRERLDWLRLIRTDNVGPVTFTALMRQFGSAAAALDALPHLARRGGGRSLRIPSREEAEREMERLDALGGVFLALGDADYPPRLAAIDDAPPLLSVLGDLTRLKAPSLALVGARNASAAGLRMARQLAGELGRAGFAVVSGLARGIDTAAHEAALPTGTIAVLAGGVDIVYPPENRRLYDAMRAEGAIIAEMPLGMAPQAQHFPRRNRLIAGLSRAVIVIEAAERSGSLITARLANEQGREVMAVPGSPLDPRCRGTNKLIREGAALIQDAQDVLEALGREALPGRRGPNGFDEPEPLPSDAEIEAFRLRIVILLGPTPVEIDELLRLSGAPPGVLALILTELELAGRLSRQPGQRVALL